MYHQLEFSVRTTLQAMVSVFALLAAGALHAAPTQTAVILDSNGVHSQPTDIVLDLDSYFSAPGAIVYNVESNSAPVVITDSLAGNLLTLSFNIGQTGTATIEVSADEGGTKINQTFTVTATNSDPVAVPSSEYFMIPEDFGDFTSGALDGFVFTDPDTGDSITYTLTNVTGPTVFNVTSVAPATGVSDFQNVANENGLQTFEFTGTDQAGGTDTYTLSLDVIPVNDPPFALGAIPPQTMVEDEAPKFISFAGLFGDVDTLFEGDSFTSVEISNSNPSLVTVVPVGGGAGIVLALTANQHGTANLIVGVEDSGGAVLPFAFSLTVTPDNDPVVTVGALADQLAVEDDPSISVVIDGVFDDLDLLLEGDTFDITVESVGNPTLITSTNSLSGVPALTGMLDFTITPDQNGTSSVTIQAEDAAGTTAQSTFDIVVDPRNDAPTLTGDVADLTIDEDSGAFVEVVSQFTDIDTGDTLDPIVISNTNPGLVTVTPSGSGVNLVLVPDASGIASIVVGVVDDGAEVAVDDGFILTVNAVNDPVLLAAGLGDVAFVEDDTGVSVEISGAFTDVDAALEGDTYTVTVISISNPALVSSDNTLNALAGSLEFTLAPDQSGTATITVDARDAAGTSAQTSFTMTVTPANDGPFLSGDVTDQSMTEDDAPLFVEVVAEFTDIDIALEGDTLSPVVVSNDNPAIVDVTTSGSGVLLTLTGDANGVANIVVGARDVDGLLATDSFVLTVAEDNDPVLTVGSIADRLVDEDPGPISVSIAGVFDDLDLYAEGDSHTVSVASNSNPALLAAINDPLGDLLGSMDFAVTPDASGIASITLEAEDAAGSTAQVSFSIEVSPLNDPPIVVGPLADQTHTEDLGDLTISFAGVFDDVDLANEGDIQSFTPTVSNPLLITGASIVGTDLVLSFGPDQNGTSTVSIEVEDGAGLTAVDTFVLDVAAVPDAPVVDTPIGTVGVNEDAPPTVIDLSLVFTDPDILTNGDVLTFTVTGNSDPSLFSSVDLTGNVLTLTYAADVFGVSTLSVEAKDSTDLIATDTFSVSVTEIFPIAADDVLTIDEDAGPQIIDVLANDFLGEEPTTILSIGRNWPDPVTGPYVDVTNGVPTTILDEAGIEVTVPNGALVVDAGNIVYTPKADFSGTDYFEYVIRDVDGDTSMGTVAITVNAQDDAPIAFTVPTYTLQQGSFLNVLPEGGLLSYAYDSDGDPLEVRLISVPTHIASAADFNLNADGSFDYTPIPTYGGVAGDSDSFVIQYWDEDDDLPSADVTVVINFDPDDPAIAGPPPGEVEFDFDLADVPLEDAVAAEANVLVMMDDSGSMDWSVMTPESGGEFNISNAGVRKQGVSNYSRTFRYTTQFSTNIYGGNRNVPTEEALAADTDFDDNNYGVWRARSAAYSTVYYSPEIRYVPWTGLDRNGDEFTNIDPRDAPLDAFDATLNTIDLTVPVTFRSDQVPGTGTRRKNVTNTNVYLPYYYDTTAVGAPAWDATHQKITIDDTFPVTLASGASLGYYPGGPDRVDCQQDDGDPLSCTFEQELQNFANWFSYYRSREYSSKAALGRSISSASNIRMGYAVLNNSNERVPIASLNASYRVGHKKELMDQVYKIVSNGSTPLRRALDRAGRHFECRQNDAFGSNNNSNPGDPECPILKKPEGQCQNNFTLLFSDGTWNGNFTTDNHDESGGSPDASPSQFDGGMFEDTVNSSLADIAMYYYERDLHPGLEDGVPTTQRDQDWAPVGAFLKDGEIMHQHMKTYTVGFGLQGNASFEDLPLDYTQAFAWGNPFNQGLAKIDDMLHAAVNGRGEFLQANNPILLSEAFAAAFEDFSDGSVSVSAVAFNSTALREETVEYRGFFNLKYNSGDLRALRVDAATGEVDNASPIWRASVQMDLANPATRKIVTWDDDAEQGIVFDYATINADQKLVLDEDELEWLRGVRTQEEPSGTLRAREDTEGLLGDIVHSAPQFVGAPRAFRRDQYPYPESDLYSKFVKDTSDRQRVVYVAANDGMLHGFDAGADKSDPGTGDEVFAYVPNKIIDATERFANDLDQLTSLVYAHRYFVDLTPTVEDIYTKRSSAAATKSWNTVLVGGLGGGGKGYFAINVNDPDADFATTASAKDTVLWEFTDEDDLYPVDASGDPIEDAGGNPVLDFAGDPVKDLGYSFSQAQMVMTNVDDGSGEKLWMAAFGNGYNSTAGIAKLFLLDITGGIDGWDAGEVVKLDTGEGVKNAPDPLAGLPNGLGTPAMVDVDANGTADLAFAGDLFGNLYRFDISDPNPDNWFVTKLFQATYDETLTTRQPITTQPYVFKHPTEAGFMIVFGTGSYITEYDGTSTDIQSIYGIWDRGEGSPGTADADAKSTRLVQQTVTNIVDETNGLFERQRIVSDESELGHEVVFVPDDGAGTDGTYGWYIDLDMVRTTTTQQGNPNPDTSGQAPPDPQYPGERAIRRFVARGDAILISTVIPRDANTCFRAPPGSVWPIDALTGANPSRPVLDINNDGVVDENDLVEYNGNFYASGILFDQDDLDGTLVDPSLLVGQGNDDFLFLSGGDDQISLRIAGPEDDKTGRLSWRELSEVD